MWGSTPKAIVQLWRRGRRGRAELVASIEALLMNAEVSDFLDGIDGRFSTSASISDKGLWPCLQRLFWFSLPTNRTRYAPEDCRSSLQKNATTARDVPHCADCQTEAAPGNSHVCKCCDLFDSHRPSKATGNKLLLAVNNLVHFSTVELVAALGL